MASEEISYAFAEIKAIRGTEARAIAKKEQEGWELVDQQPGRLQTTLKFRRPKPKTPWFVWAAAAGVAVVAIGAITVGALLEDDDNSPATEAVAASTTAEPAPAPETEPESVHSPESVAAAGADVLTVDNNAELADLLYQPDNCSQRVADFAANHAGQVIQFDGHIGALNTHGSYNTRYDVLVNPRNFDETDGRGPMFQLRDVNLTSDLRLTGPDIPDSLGVNDTIRLTAVVEKFEPESCLFLLDPVSTEMR